MDDEEVKATERELSPEFSTATTLLKQQRQAYLDRVSHLEEAIKTIRFEFGECGVRDLYSKDMREEHLYTLPQKAEDLKKAIELLEFSSKSMGGS